MKLNLFELAELQIKRENKELTKELLLEYAIKIRKWIDIHREKTAIKIMQGEQVYIYGNKIKTYANVI